MDPLGHLAPWLYSDVIFREQIQVRPTIAVTKAHMKLPELEQSAKYGRIIPDGKICLNQQGELAVTKFAVEPVWYLPGIAERFGISKSPSRSFELATSYSWRFFNVRTLFNFIRPFRTIQCLKNKGVEEANRNRQVHRNQVIEHPRRDGNDNDHHQKNDEDCEDDIARFANET